MKPPCVVVSFEPSSLPLQVCLLQFEPPFDSSEDTSGATLLRHCLRHQLLNFSSSVRDLVVQLYPYPCLSGLRFVCEDLTVGQDSRMELFDLPIRGQVGKYRLHCDA